MRARARARVMRDSDRDSSRDSDDNAHTIIATRIAFDPHISDLARRLYIGLCGAGAWSRRIEVSTREWARRLHVNADAIRTALRLLTEQGYIQRITRRGARVQLVEVCAADH